MGKMIKKPVELTALLSTHIGENISLCQVKREPVENPANLEFAKRPGMVNYRRQEDGSIIKELEWNQPKGKGALLKQLCDISFIDINGKRACIAKHAGSGRYRFLRGLGAISFDEDVEEATKKSYIINKAIADIAEPQVTRIENLARDILKQHPEIKRISVHGCILDLFFSPTVTGHESIFERSFSFYHIFVNPFDGQITHYYSPEFGVVFIMNSLQGLIRSAYRNLFVGLLRGFPGMIAEVYALSGEYEGLTTTLLQPPPIDRKKLKLLEKQSFKKDFAAVTRAYEKKNKGKKSLEDKKEKAEYLERAKANLHHNYLASVQQDELLKWIDFDGEKHIGREYANTNRPFLIAQRFIEFDRFYYYSKELVDLHTSLAEGQANENPLIDKESFEE